jgi:hypothetical protein
MSELFCKKMKQAMIRVKPNQLLLRQKQELRSLWNQQEETLISALSNQADIDWIMAFRDTLRTLTR